MDTCPRCKEKLFLPFEINNCPYCDFKLNGSKDILIINNPFLDESTSQIDVKIGHVFSSNYVVEEFIDYNYPFTFYRVSKESKNYMLQLSKFDRDMDEDIFNNLKDSLNLKIYKRGINNKVAYMVTDFFQFNTLHSDLNATTKLPLEYLVNFMLFSLKLYEKSEKPYIFINPDNIINLGDNQFTLINCGYLVLFANFLKPSYFLSSNTYIYMAPEIKMGSNIITKNCDLYSIAKIWEKLLSINFLENEKALDKLRNEVSPFISKMLEIDFKYREIDIDALKRILNSILFLDEDNKLTESNNLAENEVADVVEESSTESNETAENNNLTEDEVDVVESSTESNETAEDNNLIEDELDIIESSTESNETTEDNNLAESNKLTEDSDEVVEAESNELDEDVIEIEEVELESEEKPSSIKEESEEKYPSIKEELEEKYSSIKEELEEKYSSIKEESEEKYSSIKEESEEKYSSIKEESENDSGYDDLESTMIIHADDIFLEEMNEEEEVNEFEMAEEITIVDLESEEIAPPPVLKPPKIENKEEKIISKLKKDLRKNPLNTEKIMIIYNYYKSKEDLDKVFVISNILKFLNVPVENEFEAKIWLPEKKLLTNIDESLFFKDEIYSGTSGILLALEKFLEKKNKIVTPITHNINNFIPISMKVGNGEIIQNILNLLSISDIRIGIIAKNIISNNKNLSTIIYKKKDFRYIGIKKELFDSLDEISTKIIISKLICLIHPDIILNFMYDVESIEETFYGVMKFTIPFVRSAHDSKISNAVLNELQGMKFNNELSKTELINMVKVMNEHFAQRKQKPDFRASLKNIEITSDRFALIMSNDLIATLKSFLEYKDISLIMNPKERMKELLKYALSEEYFKLRKSLNQNIT